MFLPKLLRVIELDLGEGDVWEAPEALQKVFCWLKVITESGLCYAELAVVCELVVLADFEESLACLTGIKSIGGMK
jgi:hypothetical protein